MRPSPSSGPPTSRICGPSARTGRRTGPAGQGLFNISAVPWASFRSLHLELPEANDYLLPIFTLGRYRKENGRTLLPLAMQVHHGVTDGFHVGRFFNRLQAWADSAPEMGA